MKRIVVIGASAASMAFMTKLRSFDKESEIICFSAESMIPYNRCLLADFLTLDISLHQIFLKPENFFIESNIDLKLQHRAIEFDFVAKKVLICGLESEFWCTYDYLFLGMGTRPFVPKFLQNTKNSGIFTFHTLSDMQQIDLFVQTYNPKAAIVIGAGLNGVEAASSLAQKGIQVTIVEAAAQILPGQIDGQVTDWLMNIMQHFGVRVVVKQRVIDVMVQKGQVQSVLLANGQIMTSDMVIIAAGSVPNSELFQDKGLDMTNGLICVDRSLKTNFESVLAAGDLCMVSDFRTEQLVRSSTWSDAMLQGLCAATSLSTNPRIYVGAVGLRDSYFFGKEFYACGQTTDFDHTTEQNVQQDSKSLQKWYIKQGQLIGFVLIGDMSRLSEFKRWYMSKSILS